MVYHDQKAGAYGHGGQPITRHGLMEEEGGECGTKGTFNGGARYYYLSAVRLREV